VLQLIFSAVLVTSWTHGQNHPDVADKIDSLSALASHYKALNDFNFSKKIFQRGYQLSLKQYGKAHPTTILGLVKLAHSAIFTFEEQEALRLVNQAYDQLQIHPLNYRNELRAYTLFVKAKAHESLKQYTIADMHYNSFYELLQHDPALQKGDLYLSGLLGLSDFYLYRLPIKSPVPFAMRVYQLTKAKPYAHTVTELEAILHCGKLYGAIHHHEKALAYCAEGLRLAGKLMEAANGQKEKIKLDKYRAHLRYQQCISKYYLNRHDLTIEVLKDLVEGINEITTILEDNRKYIKNPEDIVLLAEGHFKNFFSFAKFIYADLYGKTKDQTYLDELLKYSESESYNKIRARLYTKKVALGNVPDSIVLLEQKIKEEINMALLKSDSTLRLREKEVAWEVFLEHLQEQYPEYYNLKYGPFIRSAGAISNKLDQHTTVVRYFFVLEGMYAIVITASTKTLVKIPYINIPLYSDAINKTHSTVELGLILQELYEKLWRPIEDLVTTQDVVIVPSGALFNINFEILTTTNIRAYQDLAAQSLLAKHNISYRYSLFFLDEDKKIMEFDNDFVAFAPEFNGTMKNDYQMLITDSTHLDQTYLTLLPQPLSATIAQRYSKRFGGASYLNENASKRLFTTNAKEHKIIHIGTHAESNNESPELSRLVFAKNVSDSVNINDNYLYTYEIYDENLSANLTILTACETGKPTYQPGEGMISLAHAFNYAGSESMLTSLWRIDEQSSTQILGYFYHYLEEGLPKDEALRLSKLDYLAAAEGRALHPQYWAGLILMGNTTSLDISAQVAWIQWLLAGIILTVLALLAIRKLKRF